MELWPQIWTMHNLSFSLKSDNGIYDEAVARVAYQYFEESRRSRDLNKKDRLVQTEKVDAWSANLDFTKKWVKKNVFNYGLEWVINKVNSLGQIENLSTGQSKSYFFPVSQADWSSYAAYITNTHYWSDHFTTFAGVRYNHFGIDANFDTTYFPFPYTKAKVNKGALTGNLGVIYKPDMATHISVNLSSGFRSPNVDDLGKVFDSTPGSVTVPNPALAAENAYNAEIAISRVFGEAAKLELAGYYTLPKNAMVRRPLPSMVRTPLFMLVNSAGWRPFKMLPKPPFMAFRSQPKQNHHPPFASLKYNYQIGEEELDNGTTSPSRHAAPSFGQAYLSWRSNKLTLQAGLEFMGQKTFDQLPPEEQAKTTSMPKMAMANLIRHHGPFTM